MSEPPKPARPDPGVPVRPARPKVVPPSQAGATMLPTDETAGAGRRLGGFVPPPAPTVPTASPGRGGHIARRPDESGMQRPTVVPTGMEAEEPQARTDTMIFRIRPPAKEAQVPLPPAAGPAPGWQAPAAPPAAAPPPPIPPGGNDSPFLSGGGDFGIVGPTEQAVDLRPAEAAPEDVAKDQVQNLRVWYFLLAAVTGVMVLALAVVAAVLWRLQDETQVAAGPAPEPTPEIAAPAPTETVTTAPPPVTTTAPPPAAPPPAAVTPPPISVPAAVARRADPPPQAPKPVVSAPKPTGSGSAAPKPTSAPAPKAGPGGTITVTLGPGSPPYDYLKVKCGDEFSDVGKFRGGKASVEDAPGMGCSATLTGTGPSKTISVRGGASCTFDGSSCR